MTISYFVYNYNLKITFIVFLISRLESGLICKVRFCNTLPDIPFDPKFLVHPFDSNRYVFISFDIILFLRTVREGVRLGSASRGQKENCESVLLACGGYRWKGLFCRPAAR